MKLLFITRKFPPMVGGMETMSYALAKEFSKNVDTTIITWGKSQKYLPYFIILACVKALYIIPTKKITHIHIGDGLLSPLGLFLKIIFRKKTTISIAGLDITYNFPGYQLLIPKCVAKFDKVVCISTSTLEECVKRGVPREKCVVISCGVYPQENTLPVEKKDISRMLGRNINNKKIIVTVGRLVKRKGVYWFIENVLSKLGTKTLYIIIGEGPERERLETVIKQMGLEDRVMLVGKLSDKDVQSIYRVADVFAMPNIEVKGTIEGFGIVAVEASATGLPVIASKLEGVSDAVIDGKTGRLVKSMDVQGFIDAIHEGYTFQKEKVAEMTKKYYSWTELGKKYIQAIQ